MNFFSRKTAIVLLLVVILVAVGLVFVFKKEETVQIPVKEWPKEFVIGQSVEGRGIEAFQFGDGNNHLAFVGGIHGGYEWNSVLLAYEMIDYLKANPEVVPEDIKISIIPSANPDGVYKIIGKDGRFNLADVPSNVQTAPGRFNANSVDLNRNFDCKWKPESMWRNQVVSAGSSAFSEPEAKAIRDFAHKGKPQAVIFWHSQSNAVYASECLNGILPETLSIMNVYSKAAGYPAVESFEHYEISGDAEGWLASIGIPAITVELSTHETIEWNKNLAGVKALIDHYSKEAK